MVKFELDLYEVQILYKALKEYYEETGNDTAKELLKECERKLGYTTFE